MEKEIEWTEKSFSNRVQIYDYWYKRLGSVEYPDRLDQSFIDSVNLLPQNPQLGYKVESGTERVLIQDHYRIYYEVHRDRISILRIWDSRQNPDELK